MDLTISRLANNADGDLHSRREAASLRANDKSCGLIPLNIGEIECFGQRPPKRSEIALMDEMSGWGRPTVLQLNLYPENWHTRAIGALLGEYFLLDNERALKRGQRLVGDLGGFLGDGNRGLHVLSLLASELKQAIGGLPQLTRSADQKSSDNRQGERKEGDERALVLMHHFQSILAKR